MGLDADDGGADDGGTPDVISSVVRLSIAEAEDRARVIADKGRKLGDIAVVNIEKASHVIANFKNKGRSFDISPEKLYALSMRLLLAGFAVSAIITFGFVQPDMSQDPILNVYGIVNACITFDYSPATEFMAVAWVVVCTLMFLHIITFVYRLRLYFGDHSQIAIAGRIIGITFGVLYSFMAISIVVHPTRSIEWHTVPYQVLIIGTCVWWIFIGIVCHHWPVHIDQQKKDTWYVATAVFVCVSLFKIYLQWIFMLLHQGVIHDERMYVPAVLPNLADPIWMFLFVFFRRLSPLSQFEIHISVQNSRFSCVQNTAVPAEQEVDVASLIAVQMDNHAAVYGNSRSSDRE